MTTWRWWVEWMVLGMLGGGLLGVGADWAVWRARGAPTGSVRVNRVMVAPLKGNREEYYADGTADEACSRSLMPWGGMRACWWVERKRTVMER